MTELLCSDHNVVECTPIFYCHPAILCVNSMFLSASLPKLWLLTTSILYFWCPPSIQAFSVVNAPANECQGKCTPSESELKRPNERILSFDTEIFPLREIVAEALECHPDELDELHLREPEEFCEQGKIRGSLASTRSPLRRVELLRRALTTKWKMSPQRRQWENDYLPRIVRDVIGPEVMEHETQLIYQRAPMLRFHVAWQLMTSEEEENYDHTVPPIDGRNPGTLAGVHTDSEYGHPPGEVNFFLPVTPKTYGSNSLFVEGEAQRGDFEAFDLEYGEMMLWNGNSCRHCSPRNISNQTRISFDFRVIPGSQWIEPPKKMKGYFHLGSYYKDATII